MHVVVHSVNWVSKTINHSLLWWQMPVFSNFLILQWWVLFPIFLSSFFGEIGVWLRFHSCKIGALLPEPHLQFILLRLFWRWGAHNYLPGLALHLDPPDLSLQVDRITGVSHRCQLFPVSMCTCVSPRESIINQLLSCKSMPFSALI
jgi:hypothetical protein